jgi:type IV pilus assembly protein PilY1
MLVDSEGNIREDTNGSRYLDADDAKIVFMGEQIARYAPGSTTPEYLNDIQEIKFLWSSTPFLNGLEDEEAIEQRPYDSTASGRYIFTFADKDDDGVVKDPGNEIQPFDNATCSLGATNNFCNFLTLYESTSRILGDAAGSKFNASQLAELATRQVDFIRGAEISNKTFNGYKDFPRSRSLDDSSGPWRLGDIVYSSPTIVGAPSENYHRLYKDKTYQVFFEKYRNRRQVLYVGANDGMLHAFNAGFYNSNLKGFDLSQNGEKEYPLGMEMWAYVPYNLLPHLKWLMNPDYGGSLHVPYMDLKPRIFDARIFVDSNGVSQNEDIYPHGWGTVLVAGMRLGGAEIDVDMSPLKNQSEIRTMSSAYVIMDITNPEAPPKLLAEVRLPGQGFTTCYPTVMPMATAGSSSMADSGYNHWFLVFGSGPADSTGKAVAFPNDYRKPAVSSQNGKLFVLDLKALAEKNEIRTLDGTSKSFSTSDHLPFATTEAGSFISDPIAVDLDIGATDNSKAFKTDVVYFGTVSGDEINSGGTMRRLTTNNVMPTGGGADWSTSTLIDVGLPVTSAASAAVDDTSRLWIYFGAGRFYNRDDIPQTQNMSFFGIKEPIDTSTSPNTYNWDTVYTTDLYNSTQITLKSTARCGTKFTKDCIDVIKTTSLGNSTMGWDDLIADVNSASGGWRQDFIPGWERVLGQPAILGGTVLFTSYIPDTDICEPEGLSRLYALFYKTGTAYYDPILGTLGDTLSIFAGLGKGLAITPSIHVGDDGVTAYIQTSSGAIETIEVETPFSVRPGPLFWRKNTN